MMKKLFLCAFTLAVISACTFRTNVHFNEDWSGSLEYVLDISPMNALMDDTTERVSLLDDPESGFSVSDYESIKGVSNVKLAEDLEAGIYTFSLDFADVDVLNRVIAGEDPFTGALNESGEDGEPMRFELKKNKLAVHLGDFEKLNETLEEDESFAYSGMESMVNYEINLTFDRKIKKFKTKGATEQIGYNKVKFDMNFGALSDLAEVDQSIKLVLE
jgi:hypothetical protein